MESTSATELASLVSPVWLASHLGDSDVVVLDCSWYLPSSGCNANAEYQAAHIPRAIRFDLDAVSDHSTDLPHMLPSPEQFAATVERLGIRPTDRVICYDGSGVNLSAARVWWMFRVFGHHRVAVLNGGFAAWSAATRPVQRGTVRREPTGYPVPRIDRSLVRSMAEVKQALAGPGGAQIADCRSVPRFRGEVDEPRPGVRRGHIPGSRNVPYSELTDAATGLMQSPAALRALVAEQGLDIAQPIIASCGSGTSACVLALAVEVIRESGARAVGPPVAVYDGSWSEWGKK
ncbi:MAG: 3-mercaptopyruvate sulfurtransferase [Gemmatimonadales bacterium]